MKVVTIRIPHALESKLRIGAARRLTSISNLCRIVLDRNLDRVGDPTFGQSSASAALSKPVLERLLAAALCCEELAIRQLQGDKNRAAILAEIERRVVDRVNGLMEENGENGVDHAG